MAAAGLLGCGDSGGGDEGPTGGPNPQPAFYLTADNASELKRKAYAAGARFARSQGSDDSVLILDFGAARLKHGEFGVALREGTFFTNEEVGAALQQAARGYDDHHKQGSVTIVYANSNALLGKPGPGYTRFDEDIAREAGRRQAETVAALDTSSHQSATVGGDIEPGYDIAGKPEVSIAMVAGADAASEGAYHNVGTAPCSGSKCVNGWTPRDICDVAGGRGRVVLPEIYSEDTTDDQPSQWAAIEDRCGVNFAGVSASPADGSLSTQESYQALRAKTSGKIPPVIIVFPG